jgi:ankyrin repeat protein
VEFLLERGAEINFPSQRSFVSTPYHMDPELVKRYGLTPVPPRDTDPFPPSPPHGKTPLDLAEENGHSEAAELLRSRGGKGIKDLPSRVKPE